MRTDYVEGLCRDCHCSTLNPSIAAMGTASNIWLARTVQGVGIGLHVQGVGIFQAVYLRPRAAKNLKAQSLYMSLADAALGGPGYV